MAEFCLKCFNEMNNTHYTSDDLTIDYTALEICEGCGKYKYCILTLQKPSVFNKILNKKYKNDDKS